MPTLIKNAWILTMDDKWTQYHPGYLLFDEDTILEVGSHHTAPPFIKNLLQATTPPSSYSIIDAQDGILIPGMINAHTHVGMVPFRSLGDDMPDRLRRFLFPLEEILTEDLVRASARYAMGEMLLSGITTFADMYYFEEAIAQETHRFQMRALLGETVIEHPTCDAQPNEAYAGLRISEEFIPIWKNQTNLISPMIAPHAPNTNNVASLEKVKDISERYDVPVMIHLNEMDYEMRYFRENYQSTPVEFLQSIGLLNDRLIAVHCIHTSRLDIEKMAQAGGKVVHCIGANLKSGKGIAPIPAMIQAGIPVALGTDGPSSGNTLELFSIMRTTAIAHKTNEKQRDLLPSHEVLYLATRGGAAVLGLEDHVGQLKAGMKADLTLIETHSVNMFPVHDAYSAIVYSANASNVEHVWVNGKHLVSHKQLVHTSLHELKQALHQQMSTFNKRAEELSN